MLVVAMLAIAALLGAGIALPVSAMTANARTEIGYDAAPFWGLGPSLALGACVALLVAGVGALWSWFGGASAILAMSGARPITKADDPQLLNVVEELAIAAGIPVPRVFLIDSGALNAFATGRDPSHAAVAITRGLRDRLTRDELAGVMAHELSHVRNYDIRFAMLMATMVGLIVFAADAFRRGMFRSMMVSRRSGSRRESSGRGGAGGGAIVAIALVIALLLSIIAPILATLIHLAFSRQREYLADAGAVELTRYPEGLASALRKLAESPAPLAQANRATEHLYIVRPLFDRDRDGIADPGSVQNLDSVFSTHPPVEKRIARLMALTR
jgi:heat shock protein HtpX